MGICKVKTIHIHWILEIDSLHKDAEDMVFLPDLLEPGNRIPVRIA